MSDNYKYSDDGIWTPNGKDDYNLEPLEAMPSSWVDDSGVRHAVVYDEGQETIYQLKDGKVLVEVGIF